MATIVVLTVLITIYIGGFVFLSIDFMKETNIKFVPFPEKLLVLFILLFWPAMFLIEFLVKFFRRKS